MIWFTADTHLGHTNIIKYCDRPFDSIEEMDQKIINNWNKVVKPEDVVYHLGDFAWWRPKYYREQLNGKIHLILGNHDYKRIHKGDYKLFESVNELFVLRYKDLDITLCHYSMRVWHKSHYNQPMLFGHSHGTLEPYGKSFDVGVDNNNYTPINIDEVIYKLSTLEDNIGYTILKNKKQELTEIDLEKLSGIKKDDIDNPNYYLRGTIATSHYGRNL